MFLKVLENFWWRISGAIMVMSNCEDGGRGRGRGKSWFERAKVHVAMILVAAGFGGYYVLTKATLSGGVDPFVFSTYRDGIGSLALFLYASYFEREHWPKMTLEVAGLVLSMAIFGVFLQQTFFLFGLQYTNVVFSSIVMNCTPATTFLIAVIFRAENVYFCRRDGQAKVLGILFCITGATILTLYKGPIIFRDPSVSPLPGFSLGPLLAMDLQIDTWRLGALCLLCCTVCAGTFFNLQAPALRRFPAPLTLMSLTTLLGTCMFATASYFRVNKASDWILSPGPDLYAAIYASGLQGTIASGMCLSLSCWAIHQSGPVLVAAYSPMQPIFSTFFGVIFLNSALYIGSLLGAISVLIGLFLVVWGTHEGLRLTAPSLQIPTHGSNPSLDTAKPSSLLVEPLLA